MLRGHVIAGVDGSPAAVQAQDAAAVEAVLRGVPLELLYAVPDPDEAPPILTACAARVRARHPGLEVHATAVREGPAAALVRHGAGAALIVVGPRRTGRFTGAVLPSVTRRTAARTRTPLMLANTPHTRPPTAPGPVILLLGHEDEQDADAALFAFTEAARRDVALLCFRADGTPARSADGSALLGAVRRSTRTDRMRRLLDATGSAGLLVMRQHHAPLQRFHPVPRRGTS